ncbi:MAG: GNAT family N-acetyltransferase [Solirubrobacterales bacterium]
MPSAEPPQRIRRASIDDVPELADALARAFHDDPGFGHLLPDPSDRTDRLRIFFETELRETGIPLGLTWTTDDLAGGAIWMPPDRWRVPVTTTMRELRPMTRVFGRRLPLALRSRLRMEARHPGKPPHGYLVMMGVAPERQGRGLGTALLEPGLGSLDTDRVPAYLEASSTRSRELYRRNGFEVTGGLDLPSGGPPLWLMWREPG